MVQKWVTMDKRNELVSVITAFYNEEQFITETIESVIRQKYTHWELILIDDGSSDGSTAIAKKYAEQYKGKIIYTDHANHVNKGLSASRNHGISIAKGTLLGLLDADDVWLPGKLKSQIALFNKYPEVAMVCEASTYWYSWRNKRASDIRIQVGQKQDKIFYPGELLECLYPLSPGYAPCPSGIMIRKEIAEKHGCFEAHFTGKYQLYEDQAFLHKIYLNENVYISSASNNKYRQRVGSLVQAIRSEGNYDVVRKYFLEWLYQYIHDNGFVNDKTSFLLKKAFRRYEQRNNPLVTVVTIFKGNEQALSDTIESLLNQTYQNWEFILIANDASDESVAIAKSVAAKLPNKIRLLTQSGEIAARNFAIEKASGEYISFLDVGYTWLPEKLEMQLESSKQFPEAGMLCEVAQFNSKKDNNVIPADPSLPDDIYNAPQLFFKLKPFGEGETPKIGSALFDIGIIRSIDGFDASFGESGAYAYDAFLVKCYLNFPIYVSSACNSIYRELPGIGVRGVKDQSYFLSWAQAYMEKFKTPYPAAAIHLKKIILSHKYPRLYKVTATQYFKIKERIKNGRKR